jgi:hypothetical protein
MMMGTTLELINMWLESLNAICWFVWGSLCTSGGQIGLSLLLRLGNGSDLGCTGSFRPSWCVHI